MPSTTVVIIPRESHSRTLLTLRRVLEHTTAPCRIVVVEGGSPRRVRAKVDELAAAHDILVIRKDRIVSENEARNLALTHVSTEFVAMLDNTVMPEAGWLERLHHRARETGAAIVTPIVIWGPPDCVLVHSAGAQLERVEHDGGSLVKHDDPLCGQLVESLGDVQAEQVQMCDFHCVLARTDALRRIGSFDEELLGSRLNTDTCLRVGLTGATIWRDPSFIRYDWPARLRLSDQAFFLWRWSAARTSGSTAYFNAKWGLISDAEDTKRLEDHRAHRVRRFGRIPPRGWQQTRWRWAHRTRRGLDLVLTPVAGWVMERRRRRGGPARIAHAATWMREAPLGR